MIDVCSVAANLCQCERLLSAFQTDLFKSICLVKNPGTSRQQMCKTLLNVLECIPIVQNRHQGHWFDC